MKITRNELLCTLSDCQNTCAPIEISIGSVSDSNQVKHDTIIIKECPPVILNLIADMNNKYSNIHASISKSGLQITIF